MLIQTLLKWRCSSMIVSSSDHFIIWPFWERLQHNLTPKFVTSLVIFIAMPCKMKLAMSRNLISSFLQSRRFNPNSASIVLIQSISWYHSSYLLYIIQYLLLHKIKYCQQISCIRSCISSRQENTLVYNIGLGLVHISQNYSHRQFCSQKSSYNMWAIGSVFQIELQVFQCVTFNVNGPQISE